MLIQNNNLCTLQKLTINVAILTFVSVSVWVFLDQLMTASIISCTHFVKIFVSNVR
jgi:hypothetical protein